MLIHIPDEIARSLGPDERAVIAEVVVALYKTERISLGLAASVLGIDRIAFQAILDERDLDVNDSMEEVERDIQVARKVSQQLARDRRR